MNSLDRSLVIKAGYDHGWEFVVEDSADFLSLGSANHVARATIRSAHGGGWSITLPPGAIPSELARITETRRTPDGAFLVRNDREMGTLLSQAARLAKTLPDLPKQKFARTVAAELSVLGAEVLGTEVERLVRQRVGQDIYRESLLDYWGGACAVTGIVLPELLRASHSKAWADCDSDSERLDVFNGFLLAAHLDALFDRHLMTFDSAGRAEFSPRVDEATRKSLGISNHLHLRWISPEHERYLAGHRSKFTEKCGSSGPDGQ